jgi:hypothetical protein
LLHTIYPWIADDNRPFRELKLSDFGPNILILQSNLLYSDYFIAVGVTVNIGTKSNVAMDLAIAQTDYGFMQFVLIFGSMVSVIWRISDELLTVFLM